MATKSQKQKSKAKPAAKQRPAVNYRKYDRVEWIAYLPMIIALGYIPLIVRAYIYAPTGPITRYIGHNAIVDFYMAYKSVFIVAAGCFAIVMVLASLPTKPFRKDKIFIPLGIYALMVILSGVITPYRHMAFFGSFEMFESWPVIISYVVISVATYHFVSYDGLAGLKVLLYGAIPGVLTLLTIGVGQFLKLDLFRTDFGKSLMISKALMEQIGDINFTFSLGTVYATLYNTNFVGFYTSVFLTLFIALIFAAQKIWQKIVCGIGAVFSVICLFGSKTSSAWLATVMMIAVFVLIWAFRKKKRGFIVLGAMVLCGILGIGLIFTPTAIGKRAYKMLFDDRAYEYEVTAIKTSAEGIDFTLNTGSVNINYDQVADGSLDFTVLDTDGVKMQAELDDSDGLVYNFSGSETVRDFYIEQLRDADGEPLIEVSLGKDINGKEVRWPFNKSGDTYYYLRNTGEATSFPENPPYADIFPNMFMTGRGSIWNFTIPTLPRHIILGSGANTYIMTYPQDDFISEQIVAYAGHSLDVKPHSFYLQQWSDNGLIALIALMTFFVMYGMRALKLYYSTSWKDPRIIISLGCFVGTCGWLFMGLANDSNVCTSMPMWTIMAVGFAIDEYMIKERSGE